MTAGAISEELAQLNLSETTIVNGDTAIYGTNVREQPTSSGTWTITVAENQVALARHAFEDLWAESWPVDRIPNSLDLEEPLVQSAPVISSVAAVLCQGDHVDPSGCAWYHGTWQYLRLMNLVSTPSWHHEFYTSRITEAIERGARDILVSGTADYSVFAYVVSCLGKYADQVSVTIVDLCNTPLFACQWYAKRVGIHATTVSEDIRAFAKRNPGSFDLIVTDAFLTRFSGTDVHDILQQWRLLLRTGGAVVTTVRAHEEVDRGQTAEEAIASFRERASARWKRWQTFINIGRAEVSAAAENYASRMVSNPIGGSEDIIQLVEREFEVESQELASVPGELFPSRYLRITLNLASKEGE